MSSARFATPDALLAWLKQLAGEQKFVAPHPEGPSVVFRAYAQTDVADLAPMLRRATTSPKAVILPVSETLFTFSSIKDAADPSKLTTTLDPAIAAEPTVLFGGRPCDARGFIVLDRPYLQGKHKDPYYAARRAATTIVTQACPTAFSTCFCHQVGSHPADAEGSDILFTAVDGGFVIQSVTEKGEKLLASAKFTDAGSKSPDAAHQAAAATLPKAAAWTNVPARVAARFQDDAFWVKETAKCLSCGACTYVCPTCQCFTVTDEGSTLKGRRVRSWDSCMKPQFTLEASGHNPRGDKAKRMKNRISHKFSYYPQTYAGAYSCCGCGRCVASCPVSLDIRHMVDAAIAGMAGAATTGLNAAAATATQVSAMLKPSPAESGKSAVTAAKAEAPKKETPAPKKDAAPKKPAPAAKKAEAPKKDAAKKDAPVKPRITTSAKKPSGKETS